MKSPRLGILCCALCSLLGACFGGQTGQEGEKAVPCAPERSPLQAEQITSLGFSASQLEAVLAQPLTLEMAWSRMGSSTRLTLRVLEVRARTLNVSTNGMCPDLIELKLLIAVATEDGLLNEQLEATVSAEAIDAWTLYGEVAFEAIAGSLTAADLDLDPNRWQGPRLALRLWRSASEQGAGATITGLLSLYGDNPSLASPALADLHSP